MKKLQKRFDYSFYLSLILNTFIANSLFFNVLDNQR